MPRVNSTLGLAFAIDAHVARGDAAYGAIFVIKHFGGGEAGIDLDPHGFRLLASQRTTLPSEPM